MLDGGDSEGVVLIRVLPIRKGCDSVDYLSYQKHGICNHHDLVVLEVLDKSL